MFLGYNVCMNKIVYQDKLLYPKILWQRPVHKYNATAGKVMVLAGSKNMSGAAMLACEAVFRSGTGILLLGFPESLSTIYKGVLPEAMTLELPESPGHTLAKKADTLILENAESCDVLIVGPGLSENAETIQLIWEVIFTVSKPVVLCADGIVAFTKGIEVMRSKEDETFMNEYLAKRHNELILVLNKGDAKKLAKALKIDIKLSSVEILAAKLDCTIVLTGEQTIIATNTGDTIITRLEGPEHVTDDSNSILTSIIGSFVAQNPGKHSEGIATAVYLHDLATKLASTSTGKKHILASDVIRYLGEAIKQAEEI